MLYTDLQRRKVLLSLGSIHWILHSIYRRRKALLYKWYVYTVHCILYHHIKRKIAFCRNEILYIHQTLIYRGDTQHVIKQNAVFYLAANKHFNLITEGKNPAQRNNKSKLHTQKVASIKETKTHTHTMCPLVLRNTLFPNIGSVCAVSVAMPRGCQCVRSRVLITWQEENQPPQDMAARTAQVYVCGIEKCTSQINTRTCRVTLSLLNPANNNSVWSVHMLQCKMAHQQKAIQ